MSDAGTIGTLSAKLVVDTSGFSVGLKSAVNSLDGMNQAVKKTTEATQQFNDKGIKTVAKSLSTLGAMSTAFNLTALNSDLGSGAQKAAQFGSVLMSLTETAVLGAAAYGGWGLAMGKLTASAKALGMAMVTSFLPILVILGAIGATIATVVGAMKQLRGGLDEKLAGKGFLGTASTVVGAGFEEMIKSVGEMKDKLFGFSTDGIEKDAFGRNIFDEEMQRSLEKMEEDAKKAAQRTEDMRKAAEKFYSEWGGVEHTMQGFFAAFEADLNKGVALDFGNDNVSDIFSGLQSDLDASIVNDLDRAIGNIESFSAARIASISDAADKMEADARVQDAGWGATDAGNAAGMVGQAALSRGGDMGNLVSAGIQGGQTAGPWGAVAAVFAQLATSTKSFGNIVRSLNGVFQSLVAMIEPLIRGLQPLVYVLGTVLAGIAIQLAPVFEALAPALVQLGEMIRMVMLGIGYVVYGIGQAWNTMLNAYASIFDALGDIKVKGFGRIFDWANDYADSIREGTIDQSGLVDTLAKLSSSADHSSYMMDRQGASAERTAAAMDEVAGVLNAPQGFKLDLERYMATKGESATGMSSWASRLSGAAGGATSYTNVQQVLVQSPPSFAAIMDELNKRVSFSQQAAGGAAPATANAVPNRAPPALTPLSVTPNRMAALNALAAV